MVVGIHRTYIMVPVALADGSCALLFRHRRGGGVSQCGGSDREMVPKAGARARPGIRVGRKPPWRSARVPLARAHRGAFRLERDLLVARCAWCGVGGRLVVMVSRRSAHDARPLCR